MKFLRRSVMALCVSLLFSTISSAQTGGKVPLPSSPTLLVTVSPATRANLPQFDEATVKKFSPLAFIVTNNSDLAITGIYIRWSFPDPSDGHTITHDLATDSYKVLRFSPVVPAHERLLVAPGVLLRESLASNTTGITGATTSPHVGQSLVEQLDGSADPTLALSFNNLTVKIESIIFEDGSVYGQTEVTYDSEIQNRILIGTALAQQIRNAMAKGEDLNAMFSQILQTRVGPGDSAERWRNMYVRSLQKKSPDSPFFKARLNSMENPQELPAFVRK